MSERLRNIAGRQREALAELEAEITSIENSDLSKENTLLKARHEKMSVDFEAAKDNAEKLAGQNVELKNALYEQIYNEKLSMVNASQKKLDIYFGGALENAADRLTELENGIKGRIDAMSETLRKNNVDIKDAVYEKLDGLSAVLNQKVTQSREILAKQTGAFSENEREEFERLKNEQITEEQILAVTKKNNFERFVGLNVLNAAGVFLIIIGVITIAQFTYTRLPDAFKGVMMFAIGGLMLVGGELLNRKKANIFSLGVTAGGMGVLYAALAISYFGLEILDMYPAIGLCVLITAGAFVLSTRYNSQTIISFALIGGYLPIFSIAGDITIAYGAMIYFVVLNILALGISFRKKWRVSAFIGLFLNIIGTVYVIIIMDGLMYYRQGLAIEQTVTLLYVVFAFLVYTLIPIAGTYTNKLRFKASDIVLLGINTFFSSLIMYVLFYIYSLEDYTGILAVVFALVYLLLGRFIEKKFADDEKTRALFYLTGFAFVVLVIPFQFGEMWLSLGWLAEGVALTTYGILRDEKNFKKIGFVINALCLYAFLWFDILQGASFLYGYQLDLDSLFAYKYFAVTLGSLIILGSYMYKKTLSSGFQKVYKYLAIINLWVYSVYTCSKLYDFLWERLDIVYTRHLDSLAMYLAVTLTYAVAYGASRIKVLSDTGTKIITAVLYVGGIIWLLLINGFNPWVRDLADPVTQAYREWLMATIIGTIILIIISFLSILAMRDLLKLFILNRRLGVEWYPLILSAYFVALLTQSLITQYDLEFASAWISIIYVLTALAWIVFGFARRYSFIRRFGLGLAMLAVIKLFVIDLWGLTVGYRILSYFALGVTLIAISFVYQYFNKRFELQSGAVVNVEENH